MTNITLYNNFSGFITKLCSAGKNSLNARRCENKCFIVAYYFLSHTLPSKLLLRICSTKEFIWSQENRTFLRASISSVGLLYIIFFCVCDFVQFCLYCPKYCGEGNVAALGKKFKKRGKEKREKVMNTHLFKL